MQHFGMILLQVDRKWEITLKKATRRIIMLLLIACASYSCAKDSSQNASKADWEQYQAPNRGAPGNTQDAGSRPLCPEVSKPFTALSPLTNWIETLEPHPTFWLYIPNNTHAVRLILRDEPTQQEVYRTTYSLTHTQGIGHFSLPDEAPPLEIDRFYNWQFDLICDADNSSRFRVSGLVVRRSPSPTLLTQLESAFPPEKVDLLAANGLWLDALTILAQQRLAEPRKTTLAAGWANLLSDADVRLDLFSQEKLLDCCKEIESTEMQNR